jgi:hypothetical protein
MNAIRLPARRIASERHCISAGVVMIFTFGFLFGRDTRSISPRTKMRGHRAYRHPASNVLNQSAQAVRGPGPFEIRALAQAYVHEDSVAGVFAASSKRLAGLKPRRMAIY